MATPHSESTPPPHNPDAPPWPTYLRGGQRFPVSIFVVPGIQVPDLADADGTIWCAISGIREPIAPGVGTLFQRSFANVDEAFAVSTDVMRLEHQALRQRLIDRLLRDAGHIQHDLREALAALAGGDLERYVFLCLDIEGAAALFALRTRWLGGVMALAGQAEDPLVRHRVRSAPADRQGEQRWN